MVNCVGAEAVRGGGFRRNGLCDVGCSVHGCVGCRSVSEVAAQVLQEAHRSSGKPLNR